MSSWYAKQKSIYDGWSVYDSSRTMGFPYSDKTHYPIAHGMTEEVARQVAALPDLIAECKRYIMEHDEWVLKNAICMCGICHSCRLRKILDLTGELYADAKPPVDAVENTSEY